MLVVIAISTATTGQGKYRQTKGKQQY